MDLCISNLSQPAEEAEQLKMNNLLAASLSLAPGLARLQHRVEKEH